MAPAVDEVSIDEKPQPSKRRKFYKSRRKNPNPRVLSSYLTTNTPAQSSELAVNIDSEVRQVNQNTSEEEQKLVSDEPVPQNLAPEVSKDQTNERKDKEVENAKNLESSGSLELTQCVMILRELECSGYVESSFRQKFLTWFGLRATDYEKNVVKTFSRAFKDDALALAEQLVDTFSDCIETKSSMIGNGDRGGSSGTSFKKPRH